MFSIVFFQNIYTIDFYLFHSLHEPFMNKDREIYLLNKFEIEEKRIKKKRKMIF